MKKDSRLVHLLIIFEIFLSRKEVIPNTLVQRIHEKSNIMGKLEELQNKIEGMIKFDHKIDLSTAIKFSNHSD